jgi:hypothetical protein
MDPLVDKSGSMINPTNRRLTIFGHALFFVIGFSTEFIILCCIQDDVIRQDAFFDIGNFAYIHNRHLAL